MISRKILKIHKWWNSHFVVMLGVIYYILSTSPSPPPMASFLATLALFTFASIGIASFGQLLNDATDVRQDVRSGTQNLVASKGILRTAGLFLAVLVAGIVPWFWLPVTPAIVALLALEYLLFILYSVPPVRLKGRGFAGVAADALYAYVVPTAVAALVFSKLAGIRPPVMFLLSLGGWSFLYGLANILNHQLVDETRDREEGVETFVVARGWSESFDFTMQVVGWTSAAFVILIAVAGLTNPLLPVGFVIYVVRALFSWRRGSLGHSAHIGRLPRIDRFNLVFKVVLSDFACLWFPLLSLAGLLLHAPQYLAIAVVHMVVFPSGLSDLFRKHLPEWLRLSRNA